MEDTNTPDTPNTEEQLAISWLHISEKPKFANNQSGKVFYRKIKVNFNSYSKAHYCDFNQIKTRWVSLNTATLKFSAIYHGIECNPPSGTSSEDWLAAAKTAYHQQTKGLTFTSLAAWQRLRYAAKWRSDPRNKILGAALPFPIPSLDSVAPDDDVSDATATGIYTPTTRSASCLTRPIGQKAAKKRKQHMPREKQHLQGFVEDRRKKLVLAEKKQLVNEKNQIVAEKNQIVAKKKQVVDKEHQTSETQMNDMKMLCQNENLDDPEACWVILLIKEQIKNKWLACA
ncbi:hypothetical protein PCANC_15744 [Puccinia coronata f. sp. avenae]|uniref:No apical meristem-associated C-terminal domain-containing protein n=1 Tax=Puccinia coronata f. sp. avenae TaxID=200324 RepID=A0A2N5SMU6_9BASI|nr:hypothetical protein PCANC_15744 [Puccinia coronata f. sp. avenae]